MYRLPVSLYMGQIKILRTSPLSIMIAMFNYLIVVLMFTVCVKSRIFGGGMHGGGLGTFGGAFGGYGGK
ncbi:unnamed protein product [Cylicocyclus nassatus]|uniref:Uncharacterized protein n=1 Tax=Cylicocyclus nassatus TaxID=53992 RepID=A0AA36GC74_CYLNA|nr:unnamed protein product [Cylicocyclus nassatus]